MKPEMARQREYRKSYGYKLVDPDRSIYHIWQPHQFSYFVKLRPFCAEFLIQSMKNYEIHFNTAATRYYGVMILSVLKHEVSMRNAQMERNSNERDDTLRKQIDLTFDKNRLITRDDKARFAEGGGSKTAMQSSQIEAIRQAEKNIIS